MTVKDAEFIDRIVAELDSYSLDKLPQVKKKWIHAINCSDFPFGFKVIAIYMAGMVCDLVIQKKEKQMPHSVDIGNEIEWR